MQTHGEDHVTAEAETGGMQLQAKECQGLPRSQEEAGRPPTQISEGDSPADPLNSDSWPSEPADNPSLLF